MKAQRPEPGNRVSCLCLRCVRACEAVRGAESRQKRGPVARPVAPQDRERNPSIEVLRMGPKKGPKVGPRHPPHPPPNPPITLAWLYG